MHIYENLGGNSGIVAYQIAENSVTVQFKTGPRYVYTYGSAGRSNVEHMKRLAIEGRGLGTFISQNVPHGYASKF